LINETRAAFGLAERASWTEIFEAHDRVYAAVPEIFDAPSTPATRTMCHTGFLVPTAAGRMSRSSATRTSPSSW
jgi:hypothetical protein